MKETEYIKELETHYNLLFDYMWSIGTVSYMCFLRDRETLNVNDYSKFRIKLTNEPEVIVNYNNIGEVYEGK